jgi:hypothetical protein
MRRISNSLRDKQYGHGYEQNKNEPCGKCLHGSLKALKNYAYNPIYVCDKTVVDMINCRVNDYCDRKLSDFLSEEEMVL